ncbi:MAG: pitrilysin family protein [Sphingomonas sp.]
MPLHRLGLALLLATASIMPAAAQVAAARVEPFRLDVQRFTLANGLTVLVHTNRRNPSVFVGVYYRVGSKDEPRGRSGFAHLFEHLMFQPTANRAGEYFTPLTLAGATDANASTLTDYTEYHQIVPTNALDLALWMESDRMAHLAGGLTQAVLDEQRAVVKNEARQTPENASLSERRFQQDFYPAGHAYAHPVIGSMADIDAATLPEVKDWYATRYGAGSAILVLSGDIDIATARAKVAHYFADVPRRATAARPAARLPLLSKTRRVVFHDQVPAPVITRVWSIDPTAARDMALLQSAEQTMKVPGPGSMRDDLVGGGKVATNLSTDMDQRLLSTTFSLSIAVRPGVPVAVAEAALDAAIARYIAHGPDQAQLAKIAAITDQSMLRSTQDNVDVGTQMGLGELYVGDPALMMRQRDWTVGATPAQLREVAGRWLTRPFYQQTILPGAPDPLPPAAAPVAMPVAAPVDRTVAAAAEATAGVVDRTRMPEPGPFKSDVVFPKITRMVLGNGLKLIVAERHDTPLVDAVMRFPTGTLADLRYAPGTAEQAFALMTAGTTTLDANALARARERIAIVTGGNRGGRRSSFSWSTQTRNADAGFALAADMLRHPAYPQAQVDSYVAAAAGRRAAYAADPQNAAVPLMLRALWGADDPNGRIIDPRTAPPLTRAALEAFHRRELGADGATLVMMGDITPGEARRLAERDFGDWRRGGPAAAAPAVAPPPARGRIILVDAPGAEQSLVMIGRLVAPYDPDRAAAEAIADATLSAAFDSRINTNLREDKGWTYGFAGGTADAPAGPRLYSAAGAIETAHTAAAMTEINHEAAALVTDRPITAAELEARRVAAIHAVPAELDNDAKLMAAIVRADDHDRPLDDQRHDGQRLAAVTLDQVNRVARDAFQPSALTWVVVGDLSRIERDVRALNLASVEVWSIYGERLR